MNWRGTIVNHAPHDWHNWMESLYFLKTMSKAPVEWTMRYFQVTNTVPRKSRVGRKRLCNSFRSTLWLVSQHFRVRLQWKQQKYLVDRELHPDSIWCTPNAHVQGTDNLQRIGSVATVADLGLRYVIHRDFWTWKIRLSIHTNGTQLQKLLLQSVPPKRSTAAHNNVRIRCFQTLQWYEFGTFCDKYDNDNVAADGVSPRSA